ncbi:hypothetical protein ACFLRC_01890 [Candidatus Altiarchaeota archaeon]
MLKRPGRRWQDDIPIRPMEVGTDRPENRASEAAQRIIKEFPGQIRQLEGADMTTLSDMPDGFDVSFGRNERGQGTVPGGPFVSVSVQQGRYEIEKVMHELGTRNKTAILDDDRAGLESMATEKEGQEIKKLGAGYFRLGKQIYYTVPKEDAKGGLKWALYATDSIHNMPDPHRKVADIGIRPDKDKALQLTLYGKNEKHAENVLRFFLSEDHLKAK